MLKTLSAALLAVSVLAAPALAATATKMAPAAPAVAATATKTAPAPVIKAEQVKTVKPSVLNANARMGRRHVRHVRHHRFHKHMGALKTHNFSKVSIKQVPSATKRG